MKRIVLFLSKECMVQAGGALAGGAGTPDSGLGRDAGGRRSSAPARRRRHVLAGAPPGFRSLGSGLIIRGFQTLTLVSPDLCKSALT